MPDILIRMEMPKTCSQCPLCYDYMMCSLREGRFSHMGESFDCCEMRLADCPLIELPQHHGDLIERDALETDLVIWNGECGDPAFSKEAIDNAPAIVPAEREGEDAPD